MKSRLYMKQQQRMKKSVPAIHEARAQENLAREMSKLSAAAEEEDLPEDEMGQTRALTDIRELRKGPVYTGSNHLMIEAEVPEKGLALGSGGTA